MPVPLASIAAVHGCTRTKRLWGAALSVIKSPEREAAKALAKLGAAAICRQAVGSCPRHRPGLEGIGRVVRSRTRHSGGGRGG